MKLIKSIGKIVLVLTTVSLLASPLQAGAAPYEGYSYSYWGDSVSTPNAYTPAGTIDGTEQGIGKLLEPSDMYVAEDGLLYVLDAGNGRIVVFDQDWRVVREIRGFVQDGQKEKFNNPQGIFVTKHNHIYIADTENRRVVELTGEGEFVRVIGAPKSEVIRSGFEYYPIKVSVDKAGRIYVVGRGVFDGIIELDSGGNFTGFMGTNRVKFDAWDYFWKKMSTKEQRSKLEQFVPLEFNNVDLDSEDFLYTTTSELTSSDPIKRLNPVGEDVLRRQGYWFPRGDIYSMGNSESSLLIDVKVGENGVYSALDSRKGRVFTYDQDGNLLYIFGRMGEQEGTFRTPVALERRGDHFLVLDKAMNRISIFKPTRYGALINEANELLFSGKYDEAERKWRDLLKLDANNEIAYVGIGKVLLRQGENKQALEYLKLGYDREYYSKAFGKYRKEVVREYFGTGMTIVIVLGVALGGFSFFRRRARGKVNANVT
ncbi:gluconolactonase [Paenibacillus sp. NPDC057934]|uniref:gluconolactonase n=1 Tax=Paenibacillus sp. NPDC057934 TaxID=3346282 RepID=UPI0036DB15B4